MSLEGAGRVGTLRPRCALVEVSSRTPGRWQGGGCRLEIPMSCCETLT